ncbi:unnamed protein product [Adineta steineri]|uniref:Rab-GAP TBC domain-containing protein n=1 Tax=Adineta steineri TaxID=433720 RepID=A0A819KN54_9BILA|nr:unnamed protein product [Adineta steineri]CAF3951928.1 unnamed protein product [Adineta steineri]
MSLWKKSKTRNITRSSVSLPSMSVISSAEPDVLKVKVYKPSTNGNDKSYEVGASKKLCIDPRLASYRTMQCLIAQAFDIRSDFTINAVQRCPARGLIKLSAIWSDWELEAAIKNTQSDSYLRLCYELTPHDDGLDDWDFVAINDCSTTIRWLYVDNKSIIATVRSPIEKKPSKFSKAINYIYGGHERHRAKPVSENDFKNYLDPEGCIINANELRQAIYEGGVEPAFRKIIWRHLLNIFPVGITSRQRVEYLKDVANKYENLKKRWQEEQHTNDHIRTLMRLIHTDVLRTDRTFGFYATAGDTNVNLQTLYHILITYCVSHPNIKYCQGMNEYASTLLYVMRDESLTYLCFCSIMNRIRGNFATDGVAIATKFNHLQVLFRAIDPVYWNLLENCDAASLFFTYRWLLLECKREFPFNDALRVLEVMWATLPIASEPPELNEPSILLESSSNSIDDILRAIPCRPPLRRALSCPQLSVIDETCSRKNRHHSSSLTVHDNSEQLYFTMQQNYSSTLESDEYQIYSSINNNSNSNSTSTKSRKKSLENSFSLSEISEFDSDNLSTCSSTNPKPNYTTSQYPPLENWVQRLPDTNTLWQEEDNAFLLFVCISILLTHRNDLIKQKHLEEQDFFKHFNGFHRRHHAEKLLVCARNLYGQYIQWARKSRMHDDLRNFSSS